MVEIEYSPVKKIVVHEIIKNDLDDFIRHLAVSQGPDMPPGNVRWLNGIVFSVGGMIPTNKLVDERVTDGIVHWQSVNYAEMKEYQPLLTHPDSGASLRVVNNENNTAVSDFVRWLKKQSWTNAIAA